MDSSKTTKCKLSLAEVDKACAAFAAVELGGVSLVGKETPKAQFVMKGKNVDHVVIEIEHD